jgi:hemolysin activation/secretion protein
MYFIVHPRPRIGERKQQKERKVTVAQNMKCKSKHRSARMLTAALLVSLTSTGLAAPASPDAGAALRNTQQTVRSLPQEKRFNLTVEEEKVRPPLSVDVGIKVRVEGIVVTGQDLFASEELATLYQDQLHKELTFGELSQIADKITKYFKDRGYLVAQAYLPAQDIDQDRVEIAVVPGRYGDIILKNSSHISDQAVQQQLTGLHPGAYIHNSDLERAVLLAGNLAGVTAKITLSPGKKTGLADCIVDVTDKTGDTSGSFTINNWGNRFIGQVQSALSYQVDNPLRSGDALRVNITGADSDISLTGAAYSIPVAEGLSLDLSYSKVRYWLGEDYAYLDAHGTAYTKHAGLTWAVKRSRLNNVNVQFGYDDKTFRDLIDFDLFRSVTNKNSHAVSLGMSGDSRDNLWGGGVNAYSFTWYDGSLSAIADDGSSTTGNWQKNTYSLLRQQSVTPRLYLQTALSGQRASTNLDSSERFSLGGANGVRAYPADEASGDEAWLFSSELQWFIPLKTPKQVLQLVGFYDTGVSHIAKESTDPNNRRSLSGAGLGALWGVPGDYMLKMNYAWKVGHTPAQSDTDRNGRFWLQGVKYF